MRWRHQSYHFLQVIRRHVNLLGVRDKQLGQLEPGLDRNGHIHGTRGVIRGRHEAPDGLQDIGWLLRETCFCAGPQRVDVWLAQKDNFHFSKKKEKQKVGLRSPYQMRLKRGEIPAGSEIGWRMYVSRDVVLIRVLLWFVPLSVFYEDKSGLQVNSYRDDVT